MLGQQVRWAVLRPGVAIAAVDDVKNGAAIAPFECRIESAAGMLRYVRR